MTTDLVPATFDELLDQLPALAGPPTVEEPSRVLTSQDRLRMEVGLDG